MRHLVLGSLMVLTAACLQPVDPTDGGAAGGAGGGGVVVSDAGTEAVDAGPHCAPASERGEWKLKFVFVVEASAAMCIADGPGAELFNSTFCAQAAAAMNFTGANQPARLRAMEAFMMAVSSRPEVTLAVIPFEANVTNVSLGFVRGNDNFLRFRTQGIAAELGKHANLQGALSYARGMVERDLLMLSDAERTRTRYEVVVLSTGVPSPRCSRNDMLMPYASAARPELVWADTDTTFCNDITADVSPFERINNFVPGTSVNQNSQLFDLADQFGAMKGWYGLAGVSVHTRLLLSENDLRRCGALCDGHLTNGLNVQDARIVGRYVLSELARRSGGTFVDPGEPSNLSLMDLATMEPTTFCAE